MDSTTNSVGANQGPPASNERLAPNTGPNTGTNTGANPNTSANPNTGAITNTGANTGANTDTAGAAAPHASVEAATRGQVSVGADVVPAQAKPAGTLSVSRTRKCMHVSMHVWTHLCINACSSI